MMIKTTLILATLFATTTSCIAHDWTVRRVKSPDLTDRMIYLAPNGLPDGEVAENKESLDISAAWYTKPTDRYQHGILGDTIEGGALTIQTPKGEKYTYTLPGNKVFEDRTPRLFDLGQNGRTKVITILSDLDRGASIAIFGVKKGKLRLIAQTPYIGKSNRWRNIAGIADYSGDGKIQIAEVATPHIGGVLNFWTWDNGSLYLSGHMHGFSNHKIGSRDQKLSVSADFNGDGITDLALPSTDRKRLKQIGFFKNSDGDKSPKMISSVSLSAAIDKNITIVSNKGTPVMQVGLENKTYWNIKH